MEQGLGKAWPRHVLPVSCRGLPGSEVPSMEPQPIGRSPPRERHSLLLLPEAWPRSGAQGWKHKLFVLMRLPPGRNHSHSGASGHPPWSTRAGWCTSLLGGLRLHVGLHCHRGGSTQRVFAIGVSPLARGCGCFPVYSLASTVIGPVEAWRAGDWMRSWWGQGGGEGGGGS